MKGREGGSAGLGGEGVNSCTISIGSVDPFDTHPTFGNN
jgi:hypothetical protein